MKCFLKNLSVTDHTIWKLTRKNKRPQVCSTNTSNKEILLESILHKFYPDLNNPNEEVEVLKNNFTKSLLIKYFTYKELEDEIEHLNKKKASGL